MRLSHFRKGFEPLPDTPSLAGPLALLLLLPMLVALVACGGVASTASAGDSAASASGQADAASEAALLADCDAVIKAYQDLMERSADCREDADCRIEAGNCDTGLGGCWYAVSTTFDGDRKQSLVERHRELACRGGVCRCAAPPETAVCEAGRCVPG